MKKVLVQLVLLVVPAVVWTAGQGTAPPPGQDDKPSRRPALIRDDQTTNDPASEREQDIQPDPQKAAKSFEIGTFYAKRGDYDAAMIRFRQAVLYKPDFTEAKLKFLEMLEKKEDWANLQDFSQSYLQDPGMVKHQKHLTRLRDKAAKELKKSAPSR